MAEQSHLDRVWDIIERVGVCMLTTRFADGLRARPLEARPDRAAGVIWFVTDLRSAKEHEIEREHDVGLVFVDAKANAYLSLTARAERVARSRQGRRDLEINGQYVVAWAERQQCLRAPRHTAHRRIMGWAGEQGRRRV